MFVHLAVAEGVSLVVMLLAYVTVLAALAVTVLPFRGAVARVMEEDAGTGRDPDLALASGAGHPAVGGPRAGRSAARPRRRV
ncbi:hypothetical protein [Thermobifida halotolerans]|uniref:hypothetical protein n=1 Tax=Thermobifida halotolerans TaxID=483545 RepID=UPI0011C46223|nr:hypothetical protein [Thermobifida halotolerans]